MSRGRKHYRFAKSVLDNGMVLVTENLPEFQSLAIGVWVTAGTRHEAPSEAGLSHFLEHMMFKGTEKRSALDIAQQIDRVGGEFNAFTSREYTCFHVLLLAQDYKLAAEILTDILLNSTFDEEEIERERKVILQEISMVEDNPEELAHDLFFEQAFGGHPLGKPILGNQKTLNKFNRAAVFSYFRRHYAPKQIVISVAGNVNHAAVRSSLNRYLRPEYIHTKPHKRYGLSQPKVHRSTKVIRRDLEQAHLLVGFPSVPYDHEDRFVAYLMSNYLGGGMSSTLFQEIREKRGLAYTVYCTNSAFSDVGVFTTYVATAPAEAKTCLEVTAREIAKLKESKLERKTLDILKQNLKSTILLNSDSVENRMTAIAKAQMFFGRYFPVDEIFTMIDAVTPERLQATARKLFRPDQTILTLMGPFSSATASGISRKFLQSI